MSFLFSVLQPMLCFVTLLYYHLVTSLFVRSHIRVLGFYLRKSGKVAKINGSGLQ